MFATFMLAPFAHPPTVYLCSPQPVSDSRLFIYLSQAQPTYSQPIPVSQLQVPHQVFYHLIPLMLCSQVQPLILQTHHACSSAFHRLSSDILHNIPIMTPLRFLFVFAYITYAALSCSALPHVGST